MFFLGEGVRKTEEAFVVVRFIFGGEGVATEAVFEEDFGSVEEDFELTLELT